jgi:hypothetical protein
MIIIASPEFLHLKSTRHFCLNLTENELTVIYYFSTWTSTSILHNDEVLVLEIRMLQTYCMLLHGLAPDQHFPIKIHTTDRKCKILQSSQHDSLASRKVITQPTTRQHKHRFEILFYRVEGRADGMSFYRGKWAENLVVVACLPAWIHQETRTQVRWREKETVEEEIVEDGEKRRRPGASLAWSPPDARRRRRRLRRLEPARRALPWRLRRTGTDCAHRNRILAFSARGRGRRRGATPRGGGDRSGTRAERRWRCGGAAPGGARLCPSRHLRALPSPVTGYWLDPFGILGPDPRAF